MLLSAQPLVARAVELRRRTISYIRDHVGALPLKRHRRKLIEELVFYESALHRTYDDQPAALTETRARLWDFDCIGDGTELERVKQRQRALVE